MKEAALVVVVIALAMGAAMTSMLDEYTVLKKLERDGKQGAAAVTSTNCKQHGWIYWELRIPSGAFRGDSNNCGVPCEDLRPGNELSVRYIEQEPTISECGSLVAKAYDIVVVSCFMLTILVLFCARAAYVVRSEKSDA